jgi:cellulose synthase/poly-beta-1,6-N-acetylglucosamine synthase-like glycosyltransferase
MTPLSILSSLALSVYYATLVGLSVYGLHRVLLLVLYMRSRREPAGTTEPSAWPMVTVQLPIYNELYVARRLIDAVCKLDYPRDRLEIQVLDDSDDETRSLAADAVARQKARGIDIHHLHRRDRRGYKAGALAAGLDSAKGELVAIFDADFLPRRDFLRRIVPHFSDRGVGMVQARWDHLNRTYSLLTRIQAIFLDGHFSVEHVARSSSGRFFNFNGTAGVWRRQAILESGGWTQDTLTEDLDLSYRAQLAGWRFRFLPDLTVPAELPVDVHAFKRQQHRWAKGSIQTARKLLGSVMRAPIPPLTKLEAFVHLTNNGAYLLMISLAVLVFPAVIVRHNLGLDHLIWLDLLLLGTATVPIVAFYAVSQLAVRPRRTEQLVHLLSLMALGIGLSVNNARAVLSGMTTDGGVFERTPKFSIHGASGTLRGKRYRSGKDVTFALEGLLAAYHLAGLYFACHLGLWSSLPFLSLFACGFSYVFALSAWRQLTARRQRAAQATETTPPLPPTLSERTGAGTTPG